MDGRRFAAQLIVDCARVPRKAASLAAHLRSPERGSPDHVPRWVCRSNTRNFPRLFSLSDRRPDGATRYARGHPLTREPRWLVSPEHPSEVDHGLAASSSRRRLPRRASPTIRPHPALQSSPAFDSSGVAAGAIPPISPREVAIGWGRPGAVGPSWVQLYAAICSSLHSRSCKYAEFLTAPASS